MSADVCNDADAFAFRLIAEVNPKHLTHCHACNSCKIPVAFAPRRRQKQPTAFAKEVALNSWQAEVSLTLTQRNEGARGEASLSTSAPISQSDWCVPVKWSSGLSDMTLVSLWHARSQLTFIGVDGPHSTHAARHGYFDPLFFYFCPLVPVFCLLATSHQGSEMEAEPSGACLSSMRSRDEMRVITWTRSAPKVSGRTRHLGNVSGRRNLIIRKLLSFNKPMLVCQQ